MSAIKLINLNRLSYSTALHIQRKLFAKVSQTGGKERPSYLLLVEHEPVYTVGIRKQHYLDSEFQARLKQLGADFVVTNRGGLITFHGMGQLVAYPILNLHDFPATRNSIKQFVCLLESTIIDVCRDFSIESSRLDGFPGVWVEESRKIAAIGIRASNFVTMHGVAINCNVDLDWFTHIVACGIADKSTTSISKEVNRNIEISQVIPSLVRHFSERFHCQVSQS